MSHAPGAGRDDSGAPQPGRAPWSTGPQGPWGPPPPWWPSPQSAEGRSRAETALVLGILGVVVLPVLGPFALWQAHEAERLGVPAVAGRVLGWVGTVLLGLMLVFLGVWLAAMVLLVASGGS